MGNIFNTKNTKYAKATHKFRIMAALTLTLCLMLSFTGCRFNYEDPEDMITAFDEWAGKLGQSQITGKNKLIGKRINGSDEYVGTYISDCDNDTGRDVIFGGASVKERKIKIYGMIRTNAGKATVRIRTNDDVTELTPDNDGVFETNLALTSGGNYIMVNYEDFSGTVELYSEYIENQDM